MSDKTRSEPCSVTGQLKDIFHIFPLSPLPLCFFLAGQFNNISNNSNDKQHSSVSCCVQQLLGLNVYQKQCAS